MVTEEDNEVIGPHALYVGAAGGVDLALLDHLAVAAPYLTEPLHVAVDGAGEEVLHLHGEKLVEPPLILKYLSHLGLSDSGHSGAKLSLNRSATIASKNIIEV